MVIGLVLVLAALHDVAGTVIRKDGSSASSLAQTDAEAGDRLTMSVNEEGSMEAAHVHDADAHRKSHGHASMSVDAKGELLFEATRKTEQSTYSKMSSLLHLDNSLASDFALNSSSQSSTPRRRRCGRPSIRRNRHVTCFTPDCGPPPMAFMVALHQGKTEIESFASANDVQWDTFWRDGTTRTELDNHMTPDRSQCSCDGCDEWNEWAIEQLATPASCDYPGHEWHLVYQDMNPTTAYDQSVQALVGRMYSTSNDFMHNAGLGVTMAKAKFTGSAIYSQVAGAQHQHTWEEARLTKETWPVKRGHAIAIWQYVLTCRVFNKVGVFINEAHFRTPIRVLTNSSSAPECDPNVDQCAVQSPSIVTC